MDMEYIVFYATNASANTYDELMRSIDGFYTSRAIALYRGVPLTVKKPGWLILSLEFEGDLLDLAINPNDGYLCAFGEGGDRDGHPWYCFKDCPSDGLNGEIKKLSVCSGYGSLVDEDWDGVVAGVHALHDCCHRLMKFLKNHRNVVVPEGGILLTTDELRALARLIFMLCEPSRLRSARIFVSNAITSFADQRITGTLKKKVHCWSKISRFALYCLAFAIKNKEEDYKTDAASKNEHRAVQPLGIKNVDDTLGPNGELLLILCRDYKKDDEELRRRKA